MKLKRGSNQYQYRHKGLKPEVKHDCLILVIFMLLAVIAGREYQHAHPILSPCPDSGCVSVVYAVEKKLLTIDEMVDFYATRYTKNASQKSWMKTTLHFLLYKESKHGEDKQQGDGGLAGGPLQFHEATYQEYRQIMMKRGLTDHIGSRYDLEDAIETATWAISDGRQNAWGPIARGEINL